MRQDSRHEEEIISLDASMRHVATFESYREAEAAVDLLSDRRFPVENVQIIGRGVSLVEQVTGRLGNKEAALRGALSGALVGVLFGWIFGLLNWIDPIITGLLVALYGLVFGSMIGALMGWISHLAFGGRRDFASIGTLVADRYDLVVSADLADRAVALLKESSGRTKPATS